MVREEDFEVFYHPDVIEDATTTATLVAIIVSTDKRATKVPEGMVTKKILPGLLFLLESHTRDVTPEVPVVPRPPTPAPHPPPQSVPTNKKRK